MTRVGESANKKKNVWGVGVFDRTVDRRAFIDKVVLSIPFARWSSPRASTIVPRLASQLAIARGSPNCVRAPGSPRITQSLAHPPLRYRTVNPISDSTSAISSCWPNSRKSDKLSSKKVTAPA